ncbi:DUF1080 domain-containing protein [Niabella drilacis]|uniref:HEAT repeat n=1 Tax=Niabella drilacis (strain DSM 25811 / CCM 8410 / CCUG 62505 / LMG 26954 / E90) TaxID=1285928 RepID=A0A1G6U203_NIADE|nr:family 16 glycoside hydrolase [Niabella drilacis]SDD35321.1 HEAT repeat [Niabella drilacis]
MKRFTILTFIFLLLAGIAPAQQKTDVRTTETKVADLLMKLPPQSSPALDAAIKELISIGEPGYRKIIAAVQPPGKRTDEAARYAISGLVKYLGKGTDRAAQRSAALALTNGLKTAKSEEVKDFLLQELQYVAGDEVVPVVKSYLLNKRLSDPAARVLVRVNTTTAANALLYALSGAKGSQQITLIKALGDIKYAPAAKKLQQLYPSLRDVNAQKVLLYSLAVIGDPQSAALFKAAAQKVNYKAEASNTVNSYLRYLYNTAEGSGKAAAEKTARELLAMNDLPGQFRNAALGLLYKAGGENTRPELLSALSSGNKQYRAAAVALLEQSYNAQTAAQIQDAVKKTSDPDQQADLLYVFGAHKDQSALPLLTSFLGSGNSKVKLAAIAAIAAAGEGKAIAPLLNLIKTGDASVADAAKNALMTIKGADVASQAATLLPQTSGAARTALLDIVARRGGEKYAAAVFADAANTDAAVRLAAIKVLPYVASSGDEAKIAGLLNNASNTEETDALQQSLFAAIKEKKTKAEQVAAVKELMSNAGGNKTHYYSVLGAIGGKEALDVVQSDFNTGGQDQKAAALKALASWSDFTALDALYTIAKDPANASFKNDALNSFIAGINRSKNPVDQKILMFRKAMDLATGNGQKTNILRGIANNSSLLSLVFVSRYLDDAALQQAAVQAVLSIVTDHTDLYGPLVEDIVNKAISLNRDGEASYQKAAWVKQLAGLPKEPGYVSMFNGKDLAGWKGLVENPIARAKMSPEKLAEAQKKADEQMRKDWRVENGVLVFDGKGYDNLVSTKKYEDFELFVDWRMEAKGDGGVYLRGSPQVQTWDPSRTDVGAQVGSGGLYNNQKNRSTPLLFADNPINEWNTFRIKMAGNKVTVYLNGQLVTNNVVLENYWDRKIPIFEKEAIELQAHGTRLEFRDVYVREIPRPQPYVLSNQEKKEGFVPLFNGVDMKGWTGNTEGYFAQEGAIVCDPSIPVPEGANHNVYTEKEYGDFVMRFEFQLTPGANNGLGIRAPLTGDAAYEGMELQILDNEAPIYKDLQPYQYHGSVYGIIPALRGYLKPVGEWNYEEVRAVGNRITVILNGKTIVDGDIAKASKNNTETPDHKKHPGLLNKTGHIGFLGHGSFVKFRNLRIKDMGKK